VGSEMDYEGEGEVVNMCLAEQEMKKDVADNRAKEIAMVLINMGKITIEEIAQATKLSLEDVQKLASNTVK
jgi:predicted transposase YdaD